MEEPGLEAGDADTGGNGELWVRGGELG